MKKKAKKPVFRVGIQPKLRAATMADRRTKRNRTRKARNSRAIQEFA